jgi:hypothetical protein
MYNLHQIPNSPCAIVVTGVRGSQRIQRRDDGCHEPLLLYSIGEESRRNDNPKWDSRKVFHNTSESPQEAQEAGVLHFLFILLVTFAKDFMNSIFKILN